MELAVDVDLFLNTWICGSCWSSGLDFTMEGGVGTLTVVVVAVVTATKADGIWGNLSELIDS